MGDKNKIKTSSDQELSNFISRLRKENEANYLLRDVQRNDLLTNTIANKDLSIKEASDAELNVLIMRLRKELEAQNVVAELKRKSGGQPDYERVEVSTEQPIKGLYHTGVKGMRWGVRRSRSKSASSANKSEDHIKSRRLKKKKPSEMSNAELKELTTRLQLEKQYKDLSPQKISAGKKFVNGIINQSASQVATKLVTGAGLLAAKKIITAKYGEDIAAQIMPKKK